MMCFDKVYIYSKISFQTYGYFGISIDFRRYKSGEPTTNHSSLVRLVATKHTSWEVDSNPPEAIVLNGGSC